MNANARKLRNLFLIVMGLAVALFYAFLVAGCREQPTDPQDYFIREIELMHGEPFIFYKSGNRVYEMTYDGYTAIGWGRYFWPGIEGNNNPFSGFRNTQLVAPWVETKKFQMIFSDTTTFEVWVLEQTPTKALVRLSIVINGVVL